VALIAIGLLRLPRNLAFKSFTEYVLERERILPFSISTKIDAITRANAERGSNFTWNRNPSIRG